MSQFIELNLEKIDHNRTSLQIIWAYGRRSRRLTLPSLLSYLTLSIRALLELRRSPGQEDAESKVAASYPATKGQVEPLVVSTTPRILLIESNSALRTIFTEFLVAKQFDLIAVGNGPECMQTVRTFQPTLILTGLRIPLMDGFEIIKSLRSNPLTATTPIIVLTTWTDAKSRTRAFAAGANDYLSLPVDMDRLLWKINKYLT